MIRDSTASHLAERKGLQKGVLDERLPQAQGSGEKEIILAKSGLVVARSFSSRGWQWSMRQMTLLVLIKQFLPDFEIPFLEEAKSVIKSLFGWGAQHKCLHFEPVILFLTNDLAKSLFCLMVEYGWFFCFCFFKLVNKTGQIIRNTNFMQHNTQEARRINEKDILCIGIFVRISFLK